MTRFTSALLATFLVFASLANANHPVPPVPEGGIMWFDTSSCSDDESGQTGTCHVGMTPDGQYFLTFWQDDEMQFIRKVTPDGYETIWMAHGFNTY